MDAVGMPLIKQTDKLTLREAVVDHLGECHGFTPAQLQNRDVLEIFHNSEHGYLANEISGSPPHYHSYETMD